MKKSLGRMVRMPHLTGAFGRHCRTDDDKVRLLSVVSRRSSSNEDVPLLAQDTCTSSCSEDGIADVERPETRAIIAPCFSGIDSTPVERRHQLIDVTDTASTERGVVKSTRGKGDDEKRHEWVFTLYDFDGKGTPNKEDILSIVRAIYDVLGSAKIRARATSGGNKAGDDVGDHKRTFGAFKIKLSLTADENADLAVTKNSGGMTRKNNDGSTVERRRYKRREKTSILVDSSAAAAAAAAAAFGGSGGKMKGDEMDTGASCVLVTAASNHAHQSTSFSSQRRCGGEEELPSLRHHKKPAKRRGGGGIGGMERHSPPPFNTRKMSRRSASFSQNNVVVVDSTATTQDQTDAAAAAAAGAACASCTYRDYVNLSELENCCCSNHDQQRHGRGVVHHIRHCDRHCHCPITDAPRSPLEKAAAAACYRLESTKTTTAVVRRCAEFVQQSVSPLCCRLLEPSINNYGTTAPPSTSSMQVNVQARACYQDRIAARRRVSCYVTADKENVVSAQKKEAISHERQHRIRAKENKSRSNERVHSWILNESTPTSAAKADTRPLSEVEPRGVADGSDRLYVEHKHIHKHDHYHHYC